MTRFIRKQYIAWLSTLTSGLITMRFFIRLHCIDFLSYYRCFICLKSTCHVYYSYLRQAIHGRVTSEVTIAKMQMAAIFSLDLKVWLMNDAV